ncbi:hypothetical protein CSUI_002523, partial [Cystoisospora suis]
PEDIQRAPEPLGDQRTAFATEEEKPLQLAPLRKPVRKPFRGDFGGHRGPRSKRSYQEALLEPVQLHSPHDSTDVHRSRLFIDTGFAPGRSFALSPAFANEHAILGGKTEEQRAGSSPDNLRTTTGEREWASEAARCGAARESPPPLHGHSRLSTCGSHSLDSLRLRCCYVDGIIPKMSLWFRGSRRQRTTIQTVKCAQLREIRKPRSHYEERSTQQDGVRPTAGDAVPEGQRDQEAPLRSPQSRQPCCVSGAAGGSQPLPLCLDCPQRTCRDKKQERATQGNDLPTLPARVGKTGAMPDQPEETNTTGLKARLPALRHTAACVPPVRRNIPREGRGMWRNLGS